MRKQNLWKYKLIRAWISYLLCSDYDNKIIQKRNLNRVQKSIVFRL